MKLFVITLNALILGVLSISCSSDDTLNQGVFAPCYEGLWKGIYIGEDTGNWNVSIDASGTIDGYLISDTNTVEFSIKGKMKDNQRFEASYYFNEQKVGDMHGTISSTSAVGEWSNTIQNLNGTWIGSKQ